jgi:hypothetical protein
MSNVNVALAPQSAVSVMYVRCGHGFESRTMLNDARPAEASVALIALEMICVSFTAVAGTAGAGPIVNKMLVFERHIALALVGSRAWPALQVNVAGGGGCRPA